MSVLKKNILANYVGSLWTAAMSLICVPFYIHFVGIEAYGLIGIFAALLSENTFRLLGIYTRQIEKESLDFKGAVHGLVSAIETEIPNACARMDRMVDSLERYVALAPPEMAPAPREETDGSVLEPCTMPPVEDQESETLTGEEIRNPKHEIRDKHE